ncbi:UDP-N-acetylmuramoyl-L-alanyl-D-glutamate--2,6-diaminopimelate ligase [Ferrovibrio sp.]|uniref:UDP-N-acetylmuramoyl-L-alanyl-D-glutamate--2, 6-diaminopimelate ligase n=1 Tax=Ferrovibrio sp. TaxID=1917215 RepID=UPI0025C72D4A|nr:UDP-N-acetylmuramoyl-L-alanyl-D-glutamate--2,6-diaminopimelate ligase [Ferrovibrio sp.]
MLLSDLCADLPLDPRLARLDVAGLTADSRAVRPGYLFAALRGGAQDGRRYIADAAAKGAVAVLAEGLEPAQSSALPLLQDANPRRRLALMAAAFFGRQPDVIAAVTGTSGKTSVAHFTQQIWNAMGLKAASLGTLGLIGPGLQEKVEHTTPDPVHLHRMLAAASDAGCAHLALEASSHGLDQYRLDGVRIRAAAFTNLSRDHMDYHADVEAYFAAKMRLFQDVLPSDGAAVIDMDGARAAHVAGIAARRGQRMIRYGHAGTELRLRCAEPHAGGLRIAFSAFDTEAELDLPLIGSFQAGNLLAALGLVIGCGAQIDQAIAAMRNVAGVPGRMELAARTAGGASVFVDYAHKPDALEAALRSARPHCTGNLVVVFGCGGDRDRGKRPLMGEIATRLADRVYVTDDNPRSEIPADIRAAILAAAPNAVEIADRRRAIRTAVADLQAGDLLLIAGKGHEQGQIVGRETLPFDDRVEAREAVSLLGAGTDPGTQAYAGKH